MPSETPNWGIPYPVGTDRVADGDNAMQAIAERVDEALGVLGHLSLGALDQNIDSGIADITGAVIIVTPAGPGNRLLRVSGHVQIVPTVANQAVGVLLMLNNQQRGSGIYHASQVTALSCYAETIYVAPSGEPLTVNLKGATTTGGTFKAISVVEQPVWITVEDLGAVA